MRTTICSARCAMAVASAVLGTIATAQPVGAPGAVANPGTGDAWVANTSADSVSLVDIDGGGVLATVRVGDAPLRVALAPDGSRAYATNFYSSSVSVIDTASRAALSSIQVGLYPTGIAITPDGAKAYVVLDYIGELVVVDLGAQAVLSRVAINRSFVGGTGEVTISPDGSSAYVVSGALHVVDTSTDTITGVLGAGAHPTSIGLTRDGTRAHLAAQFSGTVESIDTTIPANAGSAFVGDLPFGIAVTPDGAKAYVGIVGRIVSAGTFTYVDPLPYVRVVDLSTGQVVRQITLADSPSALVASGDGSRVYVTVPDADIIAVIDAASDEQVSAIAAGDGPTGVALAPSVRRARPVSIRAR